MLFDERWKSRLERYRELDADSRIKLSKGFERLRFARLCAYLRHRESIANIGYSIFVFRLTEDDLRQALCDPPPELVRDSSAAGN